MKLYSLLISIFFAFGTSPAWAEERALNTLLSATEPVLKNASGVVNQSRDCDAHSQLIGCNKNWIQKCGTLSTKMPAEQLSFCAQDPTENRLSLKGKECMDGVTDAIANSVLGPAYLAVAAADFLEKTNSNCRGNTKEFRAELQKLREQNLASERAYTESLYGQATPMTWESLSCEQLQQIKFCNDKLALKSCNDARSLRREAEKHFSESVFSRPAEATANNTIQAVVSAEEMSAGIIKTRLQQCHAFHTQQKELIQAERKFLKSLKDSIAREGSCSETFDDLLSEFQKSSEYFQYEATSKHDVQNVPPNGCYSDEHLAQKYCDLAASITMLVGPIAGTAAGKAVGNLSRAKIPQNPLSPALQPETRFISSSRSTIIPITEDSKVIRFSSPDTVNTKPGQIKKSWARFDNQHNDEFQEALKQFRGNDDISYDTTYRGGEGQLFLSKDKPGFTLKRFFKKEAGNPWFGVRLMDEATEIIAADSVLNQNIAVTRIHSRGPDWILRDFDSTTVPLKEVMQDPAVREARRKVLNRIKDTNDPSMKVIKQYLEAPIPPPNIQWSPRLHRLYMIDFTLNFPVANTLLVNMA